jgi:hypothetical protein
LIEARRLGWNFDRLGEGDLARHGGRAAALGHIVRVIFNERVQRSSAAPPPNGQAGSTSFSALAIIAPSVSSARVRALGSFIRARA